MKDSRGYINIIKGNDRRKLLFIGPCSVHSEEGFMLITKITRRIIIRFKRRLIIVIRVYFEKPRTVSGWKGFIYDPFIDGSYNINEGISRSVRILKNINDNNILSVTEYLNIDIAMLLYRYISIGTLGARTCESQIHRELINFINTPFGIKNNTNGDVNPAINSIKAIANNNIFIKKEGNDYLLYKTKGNSNGFIILRGGLRSNYRVNCYRKILSKVRDSGIGIVIDCNHGNSNKNYLKQLSNLKYIIKNIKCYDNLIGIMVEVNIKEGNQMIRKRLNKYLSITDACSSVSQVFKLIKRLYYCL